MLVMYIVYADDVHCNRLWCSLEMLLMYILDACDVDCTWCCTILNFQPPRSIFGRRTCLTVPDVLMEALQGFIQL